MSKKMLPLFVGLISLTLTGCGFLFGKEGYFRDRGDDYLKVETIPPIQIPPSIGNTTLEQLFVIPKIDDGQAILPSEFIVPRPDQVAVNADQDNVRIQKLGERQWIVIDSPPEQVWPRVLQYLANSDVDVSEQSPAKGLIETDWLAYENDEVTKNKYRIMIEQGLQHGSTEIHILHLMVPRSVKGSGAINWPATSVNAERETWLVEELSAKLAEDNHAGVSFVAQAIITESKAKLIDNGDGIPHIEIKLDYGRAWASLGVALDRNGFTVQDKNNTEGVYYVTYLNKEEQEEAAEEAAEEPGFFKRMFSWGKKDEELSAEERREKSQYKVSAEQADGVVVVKILQLEDPDDVDQEQLRDLITKIRGNLS